MLQRHRVGVTQGTWRFLYFLVPDRKFCIVVALRKRNRIDARVKKVAWERLSYFGVEM
jgi:hypothetical protein